MRVIFAGTPNFASTCLQELISKNVEIIAVYTQPDKPKGRGHKLSFSPVKELALKYDIPIYQPTSFKHEEDIAQLKSLNADLMIVVAYGLLLPTEVLNAPKLGCINIHGSLLPKWRGAAPIQRAILNGDKITGITIMKIAEKLDSGDILSIKEVSISDNETSESLFNKLAEIGKELLYDVVENIENLLKTSTPQNEAEATYASKLTKEEALLDFSLPATTLERYIRAYKPWPISYFKYKGITVKVHQASVSDFEYIGEPGIIKHVDKNGIEITTSKGILKIKTLQLPNKKILSFNDFYNSQKSFFEQGGKI
ncbi:MAG: methionyl-tRNA formyltransferase [Succinivibrionaceae bacterium]